MKLEEWYNKGITAQEYVDVMEVHRENLIHIYENFQLEEKDYELFEKLRSKELRVLVLTESWCGDAMLNIPILLRIAEATNMDVHFLYRDQNLELMDQYLTNGKSRSIPIFIFIDKNGREVAVWGPRAKTIQRFINESNAALPPKEANDFKEKQQEMFTFLTRAFRENRDFWDEVYSCIRSRLKSIA
ncbi:thioredoxin family protein [Thalassobacillus hwangdonensis]|uniref:Thioredoxin family protein n=1 Tax=Thalassobacillus hwangdonensis TaxID=546108 RepID=A0ABW3L665_9BACI